MKPDNKACKKQSQVKYKKNSQKEKNRLYLTQDYIAPIPEITSNIPYGVIEYYSDLKHDLERQVLDYLFERHLFWKGKFKDARKRYFFALRFSQSYLAKRFNVTREWINKLLGRLERCGFIATYRNGFNVTKFYRASLWFFQIENCRKVMDVFPTLKKIWLVGYQQRSFTLLINSLFSYIKDINYIQNIIQRESIYVEEKLINNNYPKRGKIPNLTEKVPTCTLSSPVDTVKHSVTERNGARNMNDIEFEEFGERNTDSPSTGINRGIWQRKTNACSSANQKKPRSSGHWENGHWEKDIPGQYTRRSAQPGARDGKSNVESKEYKQPPLLSRRKWVDMKAGVYDT